MPQRMLVRMPVGKPLPVRVPGACGVRVTMPKGPASAAPAQHWPKAKSGTVPSYLLTLLPSYFLASYLPAFLPTFLHTSYHHTFRLYDLLTFPPADMLTWTCNVSTVLPSYVPTILPSGLPTI